MDLLISAEKTFDKIQHPLMIKLFNKMGTGETYFNMAKPRNDNFTSYVIPTCEKHKIFL